MSNWTTLDKIYVYDGSFEGLLTIVFDSFIKKAIPKDIVIENEFNNSFIQEYEYIYTDLDKSYRVFSKISEKISEYALYNSYNAHLSGNDKKSINIVNYLINGFKFGNKIDFMRDLDCVLNVQKISKNVTGEAHRFKGLIRFREVNKNILYSEFKPDNNVIEIVSRHFKERLKNENWIIHDKKREIVSVYNAKKYIICSANELDFSNIVNSVSQEKYENLWKAFFNKIAIKERKNTRLQIQHMPKKYWEYITEINNSET